MALTKDQKITLVAALVTVLLTGILHVFIREWYQADIRYEEGKWYTSPNIALTSLKLGNEGHSDAEDIRVTATFQQALRDVTTSDPNFPFSISSGGKGQRTLAGSVKRLVPDQSLYIYFATDIPELDALSQPFVKNVYFNGGKGKTGTPIFRFIFSGALGMISGFILSYLRNKRLDMRVEKFYPKLDQSISLAISLADAGFSMENYQKRWEETFGAEKFRQGTLRRAADHAFKLRIDSQKK